MKWAKLKVTLDDVNQDAVISDESGSRVATVGWQEDGSHVWMANGLVTLWNDPKSKEHLEERRRRLGPMA